MINFRLPIRGVNDSITRPVSIGILNDIKEILYVNKDIRSKLSNQIDEFITNEQWNPKQLDSKSPKLEDIKFSVTEDINTDNLITTSVNYNDYKPVLYDTDVNAYIRPIYVESFIKFDIKFRSKSKTNINNFINMLKLSIAENETIILHDVEYMFYLPPELLELFLDINILKNNVLTDKINYEDYLINFTDGRMSMVGGLDGNTKNLNVVIKEKQLDVVGYFEDNIIDVKSEYNSSESVWEADFNYTLTYNKPIALNVSYPPMVYNQMLPKKYIVKHDLKLGKNDQHRNKTFIGEANEPFNNGLRLEASMDKLVNKVEFINIPNFDYYKPSRPQPYMMSVFSVMVNIRPDDKRSLFNLNRIPEYKLNDIFMQYIVSEEWKHITKKYDSIFYLELIEESNAMADGSLTIDQDLNISSVIDLDLTKTYRVVFNILTDLSVASRSAIGRLNRYDDVYNVALKSLNIKNPKLTKLLEKDEKVIIYNSKNKRLPYTVMVNTILAYRQRRK